MKLITFEVSDRSLAVTTVNHVSGEWNCSIVVSQQNPDLGELTYRREHLLGGFDGPEAALEMASDFTNSYIETCFAELAAEV